MCWLLASHQQLFNSSWKDVSVHTSFRRLHKYDTDTDTNINENRFPLSFPSLTFTLQNKSKTSALLEKKKNTEIWQIATLVGLHFQNTGAKTLLHRVDIFFKTVTRKWNCSCCIVYSIRWIWTGDFMSRRCLIDFRMEFSTFYAVFFNTPVEVKTQLYIIGC